MIDDPQQARLTILSQTLDRQLSAIINYSEGYIPHPSYLVSDRKEEGKVSEKRESTSPAFAVLGLSSCLELGVPKGMKRLKIR